MISDSLRPAARSARGAIARSMSRRTCAVAALTPGGIAGPTNSTVQPQALSPSATSRTWRPTPPSVGWWQRTTVGTPGGSLRSSPRSVGWPAHELDDAIGGAGRSRARRPQILRAHAVGGAGSQRQNAGEPCGLPQRGVHDADGAPMPPTTNLDVDANGAA